MVSAHAYPTFELSDTVPLLAKTAAKERTAGAVSGNSLLSGNPLPYLTLTNYYSELTQCVEVNSSI